MNYIKYFQNTKYELDSNDCWTLIQDIFRDEHGIELPKHPIMTDKSEIASYLISNIPYEPLDKPEKGCIVYFTRGDIHHAGYALNDKKFIHKTVKRVEIAPIPQDAKLYKVINDKINP